MLNTFYLVSFWDEQWRFVGVSWLEKVGRLSVKPALQLKLQHLRGHKEFGQLQLRVTLSIFIQQKSE